MLPTVVLEERFLPLTTKPKSSAIGSMMEWKALVMSSPGTYKLSDCRGKGERGGAAPLLTSGKQFDPAVDMGNSRLWQSVDLHISSQVNPGIIDSLVLLSP